MVQTEQQKVKIDNILWWIQDNKLGRYPQPLCPIHNLRMYPVRSPGMSQYGSSEESNWLKCEDCKDIYTLPREFTQEKTYVINRIDAKVFRGMKVLNLDDEAIPLKEEKLSSDDKKYFITSVLTKSNVGLRVVIYAGKKGKKEKTQIFVEPEIKRLAFDQKDLHPTDVFTKIEATFEDGTKNTFDQK